MFTINEKDFLELQKRETMLASEDGLLEMEQANLPPLVKNILDYGSDEKKNVEDVSGPPVNDTAEEPKTKEKVAGSDKGGKTLGEGEKGKKKDSKSPLSVLEDDEEISISDDESTILSKIMEEMEELQDLSDDSLSEDEFDDLDDLDEMDGYEDDDDDDLDVDDIDDLDDDEMEDLDDLDDEDDIIDM